MNDSALDEQPTRRHRDLSGRTTDRVRSTSGHLSEDRRIIVGDLSVRRLARAHDRTITDNDKETIRRAKPLCDGIAAPYLEEELKVRYLVEFARTPVSERCVFCNATYLGETEVKHDIGGFVVRYHVWCVDFLRANSINFSKPVEGLLLIGAKRWRNSGLRNPKTVFPGLCAIRADKGREIVGIETNLEARL